MIRKIRRTKQARQDLISIYNYISPRNPAAADRVFDAIASMTPCVSGVKRTQYDDDRHEGIEVESSERTQFCRKCNFRQILRISSM
jgi:plasmid stabilization system protein ParE